MKNCNCNCECECNRIDIPSDVSALHPAGEFDAHFVAFRMDTPDGPLVTPWGNHRRDSRVHILVETAHGKVFAQLRGPYGLLVLFAETVSKKKLRKLPLTVKVRHGTTTTGEIIPYGDIQLGD